VVLLQPNFFLPTRFVSHLNLVLDLLKISFSNSSVLKLCMYNNSINNIVVYHSLFAMFALIRIFI